MLFNSIDFAVFLPVVFCLYWFVFQRNLKAQNLLVVGASYFFYGWWDWRFLSLIAFSTLVDYAVGRGLAREENKRKRLVLLWVSILVNLGFLGFFKYFNFFMDNFAEAFTLLGYRVPHYTLQVVLPVGISFYTFQTLSYSIDVYKRKLEPVRDLVAFAAFVSFFPQLVAGPIERATRLLPQFYRQRTFDQNKAIDGMRQILWGFFKKVVVADSCAIYVNEIFASHSDFSSPVLLLGGVLFAFQIYGDFSGYSDIAIGTARLFGFELMRNFAFPYFSRDIAEFWRRWHISLSTWFRDYLYIPLGGSRGSLNMKLRNTMIIFVVSGFWHGANWTFIVWGALNALYFLPLLLAKRNRVNTDTVAEGRLFAGFKEIMQILGTFFITVIAWIFFRAENVGQAMDYLIQLFSFSFESAQHIWDLRLWATLVFVAMLVVIEWLQRHQQHGLQFSELEVSIIVRWPAYVGLTLLVLMFMGEANTFIYFQF